MVVLFRDVVNWNFNVVCMETPHYRFGLSCCVDIYGSFCYLHFHWFRWLCSQYFLLWHEQKWYFDQSDCNCGLWVIFCGSHWLCKTPPIPLWVLQHYICPVYICRFITVYYIVCWLAFVRNAAGSELHLTADSMGEWRLPRQKRVGRQKSFRREFPGGFSLQIGIWGEQPWLYMPFTQSSLLSMCAVLLWTAAVVII